MPVRSKLRNEIKLSLDAIYRLGHCANYGQTDRTKWDVEIVPDESFEIGVWESVPVDSPQKKKRKKTEKEPIDDGYIDYNSHLTPTIEHMRKPYQPPPGEKPNVTYVNIYKPEKPECFCYVCLIRYNIRSNFPKRTILVTKKSRIPKLFQATNATERIFVRMMRVMTTHRVGRPLGVPISYRTILEFFESYCRPEVLDVGIILNDWLVSIIKQKNARTMRNLHEVFKSLVFASVSKTLIRILSVHMPKEELKEKAFWYIKDIKKFDPCRFLEEN